MSSRQQSKRAAFARFMRDVRHRLLPLMTVVLIDKLGRVRRRTYLPAKIVNAGISFTVPCNMQNGDTLRLTCADWDGREEPWEAEPPVDAVPFFPWNDEHPCFAGDFPSTDPFDHDFAYVDTSQGDEIYFQQSGHMECRNCGHCASADGYGWDNGDDGGW